MGPYCHYKVLKNLPYCVVMPKRSATPQFQISQSARLKWIINNNKLNKTHNWLDSTNIRTIHDSNHFALDPDHLRNPLWYENKKIKILNSEKVFEICFCFRTKNATETKKNTFTHLAYRRSICLLWCILTLSRYLYVSCFPTLFLSFHHSARCSKDVTKFCSNWKVFSPKMIQANADFEEIECIAKVAIVLLLQIF